MDLREECLGAKKIGISGHIRPDGDCVGVCLSLQMYLRKLLPEAEVTVYQSDEQLFRERRFF